MREFFNQYSEDKPYKAFHRVISLQEAPDSDFSAIAKGLSPECRGWLELAQLPLADRLELTREYWLCKMEEQPRFTQFILTFFDTIVDIGIYLTQRQEDSPWQCEMIYSLPNNTGYYRGFPPASEENLLAIQNYFAAWVLPNDYLAFLQIHDGFAKTTDCTGIIPASALISHFEAFQLTLQQRELPVTCDEKEVDPKTLLPFYKSFGMPFYQCFWSEWHPEGEMGNVYFSSQLQTISSIKDGSEADLMAFPTFADWLIFYLERIDKG